MVRCYDDKDSYIDNDNLDNEDTSYDDNGGNGDNCNKIKKELI